MWYNGINPTESRKEKEMEKSVVWYVAFYNFPHRMSVHTVRKSCNGKDVYRVHHNPSEDSLRRLCVAVGANVNNHMSVCTPSLLGWDWHKRDLNQFFATLAKVS